MSLKEITELLKDLVESNKQLTLRLKIDRKEIDSDLESIKSIESDDFYKEIYEEYSTSSEESN